LFQIGPAATAAANGNRVATALDGKFVPQVVHAGTFSQNIDKQTLHTYPRAVGFLWQKHDALKSTPDASGSLKYCREGPSAVKAVYFGGEEREKYNRKVVIDLILISLSTREAK
jgi:hypothetical protein